MNLFDDSTWRISKTLFKFIGLWPFQSPIESKILCGVTIALMQTILIPEIIKLIEIRENMNEVTSCIPLLSFQLLSNIKILHCIFQSRTINNSFLLNKMKLVLLHVQRDYQNDVYQWEREKLKNDTSNHHRAINIYMSSLCGAVVVNLTIPTIPVILDFIKPLNESRLRTPLYRVDYPVDTEKYALPLYLHSCIVSIIPIIIYLAFDSMYANSVQHACRMFTIIGNRLRFLEENESDEIRMKSYSILHIDVHTALKNCIQMHKETLEFVNLLQSSYTVCFFIMTIYTIVALSFSMYQVIFGSDNFGERVRLIFFVNGQLAHLLFRCYYGQKLIDRGAFVQESAYQSNWYDFPQRARKLFIMVLMTGRKPTQIKAGNIFEISMENFSAVIKSAASYFALLRSMV